MLTCVACGRSADETHHIKPVSRRPDLARDETNMVPVCHECHGNVTAHRWRIERAGDLWRTVDARTGELLSRRYAAPMGAVLATPTAEIGGMLARGAERSFLDKLVLESDENLRLLDKSLGTLGRASSWARCLVRYEAYKRWPYKKSAIHDLAKAFRCSVKGIYEDVRAAQLYAEDDTGPPMPASWYRAASHTADPEEGLTIARQLWEQGGTVAALRQRFDRSSGRPKKHACPICGRLHAGMSKSTGSATARSLG
jgi:hypothetical protein